MAGWFYCKFTNPAARSFAHRPAIVRRSMQPEGTPRRRVGRGGNGMRSKATTYTLPRPNYRERLTSRSNYLGTASLGLTVDGQL